MSEKKKLVIKNIGRMFYAILTEETSAGPSYEKSKYLAGLREITVTPEEQSGEIYAEGMVWDSDTELGKISVTIDATDIPLEDYAIMLGKSLDEYGGVIDNVNDEPPYLALMYEKKMTKGVMEYATLYKGKFAIPEDKGKTREGNVEYQTRPMQGVFMPLSEGTWRHVIRSNSPGFDETAFKANWGEGKTLTVATPVPVSEG